MYATEGRFTVIALTRRTALRHAPPQRVLFQPDVSTRTTRQSAGGQGSPQVNGYGSSAAAMTIANYEPRAVVPATMKNVVTPSNQLENYVQSRKKYILNKRNRPVPPKGMMLPGTGFPGPNIYIRALHALRSKQPDEEAYALHHLVKISHERGDKYRFDQFPGLAEALIAKVIDVGSLFYDVEWDISYSEDDFDQPHVLNGLAGTKDLLARIKALPTLDVHDELLPEDNAKALNMVNEAALIIRNMVMLKENALFAAVIPSIRDLIVIVLTLPKHPTVVELQHYALEIAEQLTKYWTLGAQDPLYLALLAQVDSDDRGQIITSLRALARIAMNLDATNKLTGVSVKTLRSICDWLLVEDEDLRIACLDFLYLYTGFPDNVETLVHEVEIEGVVNQLVRMLQYGAIAYEERRSASKPLKSLPTDSAPKLSSAIIEQLVTLEEPERSSQWLKTCFEEDLTGEITQIQLWSAYNTAFSEAVNNNPSSFRALMPAKDFITNVSSTFTGASAQVLTVGGQPKYTIRGIRPRSVPVDPSTKKQYMRCCWHPPSLLNGFTDTKHSTTKIECGEFASGARAMWEHIVSAHLEVSRDQETGQWLLEPKPDIDMENGDAVSVTKPRTYSCHWGGCTHFQGKATESAFVVGQHIKTHLPDTSIKQAIHAKHNRTLSESRPLTSSAQVRHENFQPQFGQPVGLGSLGLGGRYNSSDRNGDRGRSERDLPPQQPAPNFRYYNTVTDEANDAAGLPLSSVLVLRNLARQLNKIPAPSNVTEIDPQSPNHKRTFSDSSPEHRRSVSSKKPRLSDAAHQHARENEEREEQEAKSVGWVPRVFAPVKEQLAFVASHNLTLRNYMGGLLKAIAEGGG
jgi:chromatin structure-remodeling complex subunit RSC9